MSYALGAQRRVSGTLSLQAGDFYNGTLTALGFSAARVSVLKQFSFEPTISVNRVDIPGSTFTTRLYRTRADYGFSPLMFASALLQYTSTDRAFSSNLRFRWEYRPGSELFVVYTDERDLTDPRDRAADAGARRQESRVRRQDQSAAAVLREDAMSCDDERRPDSRRRRWRRWPRRPRPRSQT